LARQLLDRATNRLADILAGRVVDTLGGLLQSESDATKLASIEKVVDILLRVRGSVDLAERLAAARDILDGQKR
jgi:hypothetical protein